MCVSSDTIYGVAASITKLTGNIQASSRNKAITNVPKYTDHRLYYNYFKKLYKNMCTLQSVSKWSQILAKKGPGSIFICTFRKLVYRLSTSQYTQSSMSL